MPSVRGARQAGGGPPLLEHGFQCVRAVRVAGGADEQANGSAAAVADALATGTDAAEAATPARAKRMDTERAGAGAAAPWFHINLAQAIFF